MITYFQVLLYFIIPPTVLLGIVALFRGKLKNEFLFRPKLILTVLSIIAFVYTSPWDNYLVATGIWFYDNSLVSGITIFWVPLEEYLFFILQTLFVALFTINSIPIIKKGDPMDLTRSDRSFKGPILTLLMLKWIVSMLLFFFGSKEFTYLSLILMWALPPIILQIQFGYDLIHQDFRYLLTVIGISTLYLSLVDTYAIYYGTWTISSPTSLGILFGGIIPIEEVLFFFVTTILVAFGAYLGTSIKSVKVINQTKLRWVIPFLNSKIDNIQ